jgi:hypothetical protein
MSYGRFAAPHWRLHPITRRPNSPVSPGLHSLGGALTNYMMLELLLTRSEDRELVRAAQGIRFLVFDELHTYRGRQGAVYANPVVLARLGRPHHEPSPCAGNRTEGFNGSMAPLLLRRGAG